MNLLYGAIALALFTIIISSSLIETEYHAHYFLNQIHLISNSMNNQFSVSIDLESTYTWLFPSSKNYSQSLQILDQNVELKFNKKMFQFNPTEDSFYIESNKDKVVPQLSFLLPTRESPTSKSNSHGALSLNYNIQNESYSLIHQLKRQGYIDSLSFGIVQSTSFFFGGIPFNAQYNKTYSHCDIITDKNGWSCPLSQVKIIKRSKVLQKTYDNNDNTADNNTSSSMYVTFIADNNKNYAPKSFFNDIITDLYKEEINEYHHLTSEYFGHRQMYYFNRNEKIIGNITFVIGDYSYLLPLRNFWLCDEDYCDFTIQDNLEGDYWVLGSDFFRQYNIVFDYESKQVQFYSPNGVNRSTSTYGGGNGIRIGLCVIVMILLFLGIAMGIMMIRWMGIKQYNTNMII